MTQLNLVFIAGLLVAAVAPAAGAQQTQQAQQKDSSRKAQAVPADARPPKGMCRIWLDNVPAAQQPAATDCPTAVKNRPQNAHVIFGDDYADSSKTNKLPPNIKGFSGSSSKSPAIVIPKRPPTE